MLKYIKIILKAGPSILYYYFKYLIKYSKHPEKYTVQERYSKLRKLLLILFKVWKLDYHIEGFEKFANYDGKAFLISNHLSDIDPLIMICLSEKPLTFVAKKEVIKFPFVGKIVLALDGLFLDRENLLAQVKTLDKAIKIAQEKNNFNVVIFAEGTRNKNPGSHCLEFKPGTLKVAMKSNIAIFGVAHYGSFRILNKNIDLKAYPIFFEFFGPYEKTYYQDKKSNELASEFYNVIDSSVMKFKTKDLDFVSNLKVSKKTMELLKAPSHIK